MIFEITMCKDYFGGPTYIVQVDTIDMIGITGSYRLKKDTVWAVNNRSGLFRWDYIDFIRRSLDEDVCRN